MELIRLIASKRARTRRAPVVSDVVDSPMRIGSSHAVSGHMGSRFSAPSLRVSIATDRVHTPRPNRMTRYGREECRLPLAILDNRKIIRPVQPRIPFPERLLRSTRLMLDRNTFPLA